MYIGGEKYNRFSFLVSKENFSYEDFKSVSINEKVYESTYAFGGYYSIGIILKDIKIPSNGHVLLPSYLCPSILLPFKRMNISYKFYRVNKNLEIDENDIVSKVNGNTKAILFISYFGFQSITDSVYNFCKESSLLIIQDEVHGDLSNNKAYGDYIYNSFRKYFPNDGSVIFSKNKIMQDKYTFFSRYKFYKILAQYLRYICTRYDFCFGSINLKISTKANKYYYDLQRNGMHIYDRFLLRKNNVKNIIKIRKKNYDNLFADYNSVFPDGRQKSACPLFFPILVNNRDKVREILIENNIFAPIHWSLPKDVNSVDFSDSHYLSKHIISIPIDEMVGEKEIQHIKKILSKKEIFRELL